MHATPRPDAPPSFVGSSKTQKVATPSQTAATDDEELEAAYRSRQRARDAGSDRGTAPPADGETGGAAQERARVVHDTSQQFQFRGESP